MRGVQLEASGIKDINVGQKKVPHNISAHVV